MIIHCKAKLSPGGGEMRISDHFVDNLFGLDQSDPINGQLICFDTDVIEGVLATCYINRNSAQQIVDHLTRVFALENKP